MPIREKRQNYAPGKFGMYYPVFVYIVYCVCILIMSKLSVFISGIYIYMHV